MYLQGSNNGFRCNLSKEGAHLQYSLCLMSLRTGVIFSRTRLFDDVWYGEVSPSDDELVFSVLASCKPTTSIPVKGESNQVNRFFSVVYGIGVMTQST